MALDQIEWYLSNRQEELFPGAFFIAAGNLARQVLEQVLFILAFYGGVPKNRYLRRDGRLKTANDILRELRRTNPATGKTYIEHARRRGLRLKKFARWPRSLDRWRRIFNEPSHFRNAAAGAQTKEKDIREFVHRLRRILDSRDPHLITAAVNELRSGGKVRAVVGASPECTPGIQTDVLIMPNNLVREDGRLSLRSGRSPIRVVPATHDVPDRWPKIPVLVQHSAGISIGTRFITEDGRPVDLRSMQTILASLGKTEQQRKRLRRWLRKLGYDLEWTLLMSD